MLHWTTQDRLQGSLDPAGVVPHCQLRTRPRWEGPCRALREVAGLAGPAGRGVRGKEHRVTMALNVRVPQSRQKHRNAATSRSIKEFHPRGNWPGSKMGNIMTFHSVKLLHFRLQYCCGSPGHWNILQAAAAPYPCTSRKQPAPKTWTKSIILG